MVKDKGHGCDIQKGKGWKVCWPVVEVPQTSVKGAVPTDHHTNVNMKTKTPHKYENKNTIQKKHHTNTKAHMSWFELEMI